VFVATQMKCGTTWMQQIVYEAVCRGKGNLGDDGHRHMYAVSPWIEAPGGAVPLADAPIVGERPTRIIKTHLPAQVCPHGEQARYVYVLRHPVSCFASCVDFLTTSMGPMAPDRAGMLDWFCSERMWWGPWPDHAEGWWHRRDRGNVLFLHYEAMKQDLAAAVKQVSDFLGLDLDAAELATVTEKSDYRWMKERQDWFEMHPPTVFSASGAFFNQGSADRHRDARPGEAERIAAFCRQRLEGASYPLAEFYPDVAASA
jgi:aryl sulfotransferase